MRTFYSSRSLSRVSALKCTQAKFYWYLGMTYRNCLELQKCQINGPILQQTPYSQDLPKNRNSFPRKIGVVYSAV